LSNQLVNWNDTTNENWLEQFTTVLNAGLVSTQAIGKPGATKTLSGVKTDEYTIDIINGVTPTYPYSASIAGVTYPFEIISATSADQNYVYEQTLHRPAHLISYIVTIIKATDQQQHWLFFLF
jgi:hypothetical protein